MEKAVDSETADANPVLPQAAFKVVSTSKKMNIHLDKNFVDYSLWLEYVPVLTSGKKSPKTP